MAYAPRYVEQSPVATRIGGICDEKMPLPTVSSPIRPVEAKYYIPNPIFLQERRLPSLGVLVESGSQNPRKLQVAKRENQQPGPAEHELLD